jgi:hypothetical protein
MASYPPNKLIPSIASESLTDVATTIADTSLDAVINSGLLDGIPVIGIATGAFRAYRDVRENFLVRKLLAFLQEAENLSLEDRKKFAEKFSNKDTQEDFGGALLVLIDRSEDIEKPRILGRLLAAHAKGVFGQTDFMRLAKMVDRSYFEDLVILKSFQPGVQFENEIPAQSLASQGFLCQAGIDGGNADGTSGGMLFEITHYGRWLTEYGLQDGTLD